MKEGKKIVVRQTRGVGGRDVRTRATLAALGLGRVGKVRQFRANPALLGMVERVRHLVTVSEAE